MAEIRVHHADDVRRRDAEAGHNRRAESQLARPVHDAHAMAPRQVVGHCAGAVRRVVVDDDEFEFDPVAAHAENTAVTSSASRSRSL